ncbi:GNAT family N-acetyltransferase [Streptomyces sp. NBC_01426]|uniref:GNAT family N-acetyltransferase n=1 Tax=unclassified Streptomyces TaxID=2593676 RepID=UPI002E35D8C7|nr:GNAT family N-acetyltransferase [Streptomyces sp. NBC_01426]
MTWTFGSDLTAFLAAARPAVAARPVANTLLLTVSEALERRGPHAFGEEDPFYGWWTGPDGTVAGALLCTPPRPLLTGALPPEAVRDLASALATEPSLRGISGFNGRRRDVAALTAAWGRPVVTEQQRLYRLDALVAPSPRPSGRVRAAVAADIPLLSAWLEAFHVEVDPPGSVSEAWVRDRLAHEGLLLWEDAGDPVSLAGLSRPASGTVRVGPVYTPPGARGRGYAAAVTHAASGAACASGASEVLLFTDLANPTSNGVYLRIGYVPVEDRAVALAR